MRSKRVGRHLPVFLLALGVMACGNDAVQPRTEAMDARLLDPLLRPGVPFWVVGRGLRDAMVLVEGEPAAVRSATDTLLVVEPPRGVFEPCVAPGQQVAVTVSVRKSVASLEAALQEAPLRPDLRPGEWTMASATLDPGCRAELETEGEYIVVPFTPEPLDGRPSAGAGVIGVGLGVEPDLGSVAASPGEGAAARLSAVVGAVEPTGTSAVVSPDLIPGLDASARAATCSVPSEPGDTTTFPTSRDALGRITGFWDPQSLETWVVVAASEHLLVIMDPASATLAADTASLVASLVTATVDAFEGEVFSFLQENTRGLPDKDADGRVHVYMYANTTDQVFDYAFIGTELLGCPAGEIVLQNLTGARVYDHDLKRVLLHQTAHLTDVRREHERPRWAVEGFATFMEAAFVLRDRPDLLTANVDSIPRIRTEVDGGFTVSTTPCALLDRREVLRYASSDSIFPRVGGCHLVSYLFAHAHRVDGAELSQLSTEWSSFGAPTIQASGAAFAEAPNAWATWLLSWVADDLGEPTDPWVQHPMINTAGVWRQDVLSRTVPSAVEAALTEVGDRFTGELGQPDVRFLRVLPGSWLSIRAEPVTETWRAEVALLRLR